MSQTSRYIALVMLAGVVGVTACTGETRSSPPTPTPLGGQPAPAPCVDSIVIKDGRPAPERLVIRPNCAVLFTNRDEAVVQIQGHDFLLGEMGRDQSWAHTYREAGVFEYFDAKDPRVRGTVVVQP